MCLVKSKVDLTAGDARVKIVAPGTYEVGQTISVCVQYPIKSATGLFTVLMGDRTVKSQIDVRVETENDIVPTSAQETAITGGDWTWYA